MAYIRKGKTITNEETGEKKTYKTYNEAKRESAKIQKAGRGLGNGDVRLG